MALLRFHWDFFGPDAPETAAHFCRHVDEFCSHESIAPHRSWSAASSAHVVATLECDEVHLKLVRDRLRPKRAERVG